MASQTPSEGWECAHRYVIGAITGVIVFVAIPEAARWINGRAFAQQSTNPPASVPQTVSPNAPSIITFNQSGGSNTITFNGEQIPQLTEADISKIKSEIPSGSEITLLKLNSDTASLGMEDQLRKTLTYLGYKCCNPGIAFRMQPFKGLEIKRLADTYMITIGDVRVR